jgi:hypothetical protein
VKAKCGRIAGKFVCYHDIDYAHVVAIIINFANVEHFGCVISAKLTGFLAHRAFVIRCE